jgi:hypothetical protein
MDRLCLTDAQWAKMEPHCLGKVTNWKQTLRDRDARDCNPPRPAVRRD